MCKLLCDLMQKREVYIAILLLLAFLIIYLFIPRIPKLNKYSMPFIPLFYFQSDGSTADSFTKQVEVGFGKLEFKTKGKLFFTQNDITVHAKLTFTDKEYYKKEVVGKKVWILFKGVYFENNEDLLVLTQTSDPCVYEGDRIIKYSVEGFNPIQIAVTNRLRETKFNKNKMPEHLCLNISKSIFISGPNERLSIYNADITYYLTRWIVFLTFIALYLSIMQFFKKS